MTLNEMPYKKMLQRAEFSPIDITAKAIVALASSPKECCLFNCFNNHTVVYGDILDVATREGLCINPVTDAEFEKSLHEAMLDETKREGISGLITTVGMGVKKERLLTAVNNDYTIMALYHENIFWPITAIISPCSSYSSKFSPAMFPRICHPSPSIFMISFTR